MTFEKGKKGSSELRDFSFTPVFWEGKQPFKLLLRWFFFLSLSLLLNGNFDTARGGKERRKPKRGIVYKSFRSIRRDCAIRTDGIFIYLFFFRSSCTAASPPPFSIFPPLGFYRIATFPTHEIPEVERVDNKSNTEKRKRLKKEERKWRKNKLSRSEYIHSEKNCHCC
jgi:hypothetical protein